jgi:hypothetical protein
MGEIKNSYKMLAGKRERKDHSENLHVDDKNIRMDLRELRWECVEWMHLAQDRHLRCALVNLRVPLKAWNFLTC